MINIKQADNNSVHVSTRCKCTEKIIDLLLHTFILSQLQVLN